MANYRHNAVLVAEVDPIAARRLAGSLLALKYDVYLATSLEEVFRWLHRRVFRRAIVAAELTIGDELLVARLARLPAVKYLIAVGPSGDLETEALCRTSGATAYVGRPVAGGLLAALLGAPTRQMRRSSASIGPPE